ncbi:unnamed protein product, partial [Ectocarpus sp. 4 AP-2014]
GLVPNALRHRCTCSLDASALTRCDINNGRLAVLRPCAETCRRQGRGHRHQRVASPGHGSRALRPPYDYLDSSSYGKAAVPLLISPKTCSHANPSLRFDVVTL